MRLPRIRDGLPLAVWAGGLVPGRLQGHSASEVASLTLRCGVEALGAENISKLSYYERWVVCFANLLFAKRLITPDELARKMMEVSARFSSVDT